MTFLCKPNTLWGRPQVSFCSVTTFVIVVSTLLPPLSITTAMWGTMATFTFAPGIKHDLGDNRDLR